MTDLKTAISDADFTGIRRPLLKAEMLPPWCYTSPDFYRLEVERIFRRAWNCIGRVERLEKPGDYFAIDYVGVPLLVVRGDDGEIRAFANSCRHRGTVVATGEGNRRGFVCPYHSWTYDTRGQLINAPTEMEKTAGFCTENHGLRPIRLESWAGFMFVNFNDHAEDLLTYIGDLPERLVPYKLDEMVCVRRRVYDVGCNWKVYLENSKDQLHVATVHSRSINRVAPVNKLNREVQETTGNYVSSLLRLEGSMALLKGDSGGGFPEIEPPEGYRIEGTMTPLILPSVYIGCTVDCAYYLRIQPVGPDRIILEQGGLFPREYLKLNDFKEKAEAYFRRWDTAAQEDNVVVEMQQQGLNSPFCTPGPFSHREDILHRIGNWIADRVTERPAATTR